MMAEGTWLLWLIQGFNLLLALLKLVFLVLGILCFCKYLAKK